MPVPVSHRVTTEWFDAVFPGEVEHSEQQTIDGGIACTRRLWATQLKGEIGVFSVEVMEVASSIWQALRAKGREHGFLESLVGVKGDGLISQLGTHRRLLFKRRPTIKKDSTTVVGSSVRRAVLIEYRMRGVICLSSILVIGGNGGVFVSVTATIADQGGAQRMQEFVDSFRIADVLCQERAG